MSFFEAEFFQGFETNGKNAPLAKADQKQG